jgi:hypothetical protein
MKIRTHFFESQKNILKKRGLVGVIYLANILFALSLTLPMNANFEALAKTALADELIDGFFVDHFFDFWQQYSAAFGTSFQFVLVLAGFYLLLNTFFAGGILAILSREQEFGFREFMYASVTFFGRNLRLFLISVAILIVFVLVFVLAIFTPLNNYASTLTADSANRIFISGLCIGIIFIGLWNMLFDYAKIAIFTHNKKSALMGFVHGAGFALKNFPKATMLYFLNFGIVIFLFFTYLAVESLFRNNTLTQTYLLLFIQQIFILSRIWMKISFFASQQHFYTYSPAPESSSIRELFLSPKIG